MSDFIAAAAAFDAGTDPAIAELLAEVAAAEANPDGASARRVAIRVDRVYRYGVTDLLYAIPSGRTEAECAVNRERYLYASKLYAEFAERVVRRFR
ncbi:hypothetical protein ACWEQ4_00780 [Rhodococcus sp. NPDC003994]